MLDIATALNRVREHTPKPHTQQSPVSTALGLALAEDIASDVDSPPHDKAMVDGYAVLNVDLQTRPCTLTVLEEVTAGAVPTLPIASGRATRIMTGAPIPAGAEAVVMVERSTFTADYGAERLGTVLLDDPHFKAGQNIMRRGESIRRGEIVLTSGTTIGPVDVGLLAEVGRTHVLATRRATVSVLATGNELVPAQEIPAAGQIRNSNSPMLVALAERAGANATNLGIARDERDDLRLHITVGLQSDILVLSGGVSAGVLDLVPEILGDLGVETVFHKVHLKPGKPIWFGVRPATASQHTTLVFGLPGNPVSSLVCFELFVAPAIRALHGQPFDPHETSPPIALTAELTEPFRQTGDRPTYHPAVLHWSDGRALVRPVRWKGSADLRSVAAANCLAHFPPSHQQFEPGRPVEVLRLA